MSKPSERKRRKQQDRQKAQAKKKYQAEQRRLYARQFPEFVYQSNEAPQDFVELVRQAVKKIDFRDRRLFSAWETEFYKAGKKYGPALIRDLLRETEDDPVARASFLCKLGHLVFKMIPQASLRRWIPFHDVQILPGGSQIVVSFRSLRQAKGLGGTTYYSRFKPRLTIDGESKIVGFSRHAIEQTCQRIVPRWDTYLGMGDAFAFFDQCVHFERTDLPNGQMGYTFYAQCERGFFHWRYVEETFGPDVEDDGCYYYRVGYCPTVLDGDFVKAKTLLFPGHDNTPEYRLVWASDLSMKVKRQAVDMDAAWLESTDDFRLVKLFHRRGIPQVIHDDREFFRPSI